MTLDRRSFLKLLSAGAGAAGLPMIGRAAELMPKTTRRVVVIGGGFGGTIAAKYVRKLDPTIEVVLIEMERNFISCPFSNLYIAGIYDSMASLTIGYDKLTANHGIKMVYDEVTGIDPAAKVVSMKSGTLSYDRLVVSPGVDFRTEEIEGYDAETPHIIPHAWKAGAQSTLLRKQLQDMPDGGNVIISMPLAPYRCPPGPYERSCLIADYLKKHKPKSKVILLDPNPDVVAKKPLFMKAWNDYYKGVFEYVPGSKVTRVDAKTRTVYVEGVEEHKGNVVNLIPSQRAGKIALKADLVGEDKKWCPVNPVTFESTKHKFIHVIGDSCAPPSAVAPMPKSAYSANTHAKVCAMNVVALMNGLETTEMSAINVCYSAISAHESVTVAAVYKVIDGKITPVPGSGGLSPVDFSQTKREHEYGESWLKNILAEMST
ncbi:MAG: FCSD flavin-binding domain-containing protein [Rhodocyclaceae bacterium]|nr:FCSD flavin-binding domain-containing protein [Rhodocyclaceae bacterium]